jgi:hypothetical protein
VNFKTIIRLAKQAINKKEYRAYDHRFVNADGYVSGWTPDAGPSAAWDIDGAELEAPGQLEMSQAHTLLKHCSTPIEQMVKVNSNYLRRAISAIETKGNEPIYLDIQSKRICLAYEVDGEIHRAAIACMRNE